MDLKSTEGGAGNPIVLFELSVGQGSGQLQVSRTTPKTLTGPGYRDTPGGETTNVSTYDGDKVDVVGL